VAALVRNTGVRAMKTADALELALQHQQAGRFPQAQALYQEILGREPNQPQALHLLGVLARAAGRLDIAADLIGRAVRADASVPDHHYDLGLTYAMQGRLDDAIASFRRALALNPDHLMAQTDLGNIHLQQGRMEEAAACYEAALTLNPHSAETYLNLGITFLSRNRLDEAVQHLQRSIEIHPGNALAHYNLGFVLNELGRVEEAAAHFQEALRRAPGIPEAHLMLSLVLHKLGRLEEAEASCKQAISLKPGYAEAHNNLANIYFDQGRLEEAAGSARESIALRPDFAVPHYNLGLAYFLQNKLDEAMASFDMARRLKPDYADAYINLGVSMTYLGRSREAIDAFETGLRHNPALASGHSARIFSMLYLTATTPAALFAANRQFAEQCETPLKPGWRPHRNARDPERRLKIGYVSADLRRHSVAYFIEPVLAHHDKTRFEVFCYYSHTRHDDVSARLAACVPHWIPCRGMPDPALAERIRNDGIDILVDLAGHSVNNRLLVFARKPAPVQVTYLGSPATTGLSAMDYRLCTRDTDPPGQEAWHSETLYRLPRTLWCYRPSMDGIKAVAPPAAMKPGVITFGSLNNIPKVSDESLAVWMDILRAVPDSRLVMTQVPEGSFRQGLYHRFAAHGITPQRLELHGKLPTARYLDVLGGIDIALDPFPYNGTTTTCETLWSGIPLVTLIGHTSVARSGYALLKSVGLTELAAADAEEYVRIAVALARDGERLTRLRKELPQRFERSTLRDEAGLTRDLEDAYRDMWRRWCMTAEFTA
jgi:predicted O-linked N-acetylglucosamine transferase (SPINDLY family)